MKKIILISILIFSFSCNEKSKSKTIVEGTFIFFDDAAGTFQKGNDENYVELN